MVEALARARDIPGEEDGGLCEVRGECAAPGKRKVGVLGDLRGEGVDGALRGVLRAEVVRDG